MILEFLKPYYLKIIQYGSIIVGIFFFWLQAKKTGESTIKQKNAEVTLKGVSSRDNIENNLNNLSDDKLDKLYQDHIKRD